jgi:hypothetical protein
MCNCFTNKIKKKKREKEAVLNKCAEDRNMKAAHYAHAVFFIVTKHLFACTAPKSNTPQARNMKRASRFTTLDKFASMQRLFAGMCTVADRLYTVTIHNLGQ